MQAPVPESGLEQAPAPALTSDQAPGHEEVFVPSSVPKALPTPPSDPAPAPNTLVTSAVAAGVTAAVLIGVALVGFLLFKRFKRRTADTAATTGKTIVRLSETLL
jgi:hypothetical protein